MMPRLLRAAAGAGAALVLPLPASAHATAGGGAPDGWVAATAAALLVTGALYLRGLVRLRSRPGRAAVLPRWRAGAFTAGWVSLAAALLSPLDRWSEALFTAHMVQHEILMLVAAPLVVLGRPTIAMLWAFGRPGRRAVGRLFGAGWWRAAWRPLSRPLAGSAVYAVVLWAWHAPALFEAAIRSDGVHALQHASFLAAALLFWRAVLDGRHGSADRGLALVALFATAVHASALGALLTVSPTALYAPYGETTAAWGLTPLEDQQLGGLVMWVPGGLVHVGASLALLALWLGRGEAGTARRAAPGERAAGSP